MTPLSDGVNKLDPGLLRLSPVDHIVQCIHVLHRGEDRDLEGPNREVGLRGLGLELAVDQAEVSQVPGPQVVLEVHPGLPLEHALEYCHPHYLG